ncbi:MAG: CHAT domain-containing protein [Syntrophobacterales bacterium]|nr:CHAT domain-containing protein [Syntrophobacterales bacterium]
MMFTGFRLAPRLIPLLSLFIMACAAPNFSQLPNITPTRLSITDARTYTNDLEKNKKYDQLNNLLRGQYSAVQLMETNVRGGVSLTEAEKATIRDVFAPYRSENPLEDFFRMRQIDPRTGEYDPEGKLYLLDDLAQLHTYLLVDFKKAREYNDQAKTVLTRIQEKGIDNVTVSDYFNSRRSLYRTFFYRPIDKIPEGYALFPGRIDLITPFPPSYLRSIRKMDLELVGVRIRQREKFLKTKLEETVVFSSSDVSSRQIPDLRLFRQIADFLSKNKDYDRRQIDFLLCAAAFGFYRFSEDPSWLDEVIRNGERFLAAKTRLSLETQNSINLAHYWTGIACLKKGLTGEGIKHLEAFLVGIDRYEDFQNQQYEKQKEVIKKVNVEQIEAARKAAVWQTAFAILLLAGGAYTSVSANLSGAPSVTSQQLAQQLSQMAGQIYAAGQARIATTEASAQMRTELAKYISPYSLKVNRYLDKYEMIDYFMTLGKGYEAAGNLKKSVIQYEEAVKIIERQRKTILTESQRITFFGKQQTLYERLINLLIRMNQPEAALEYVERAKSRAFIDILGGGRLRLKTKAQTERYAKIIATQDEVDTMLSHQGVSADQIGELAKKLQRSIVIKTKIQNEAKEAGDFELQSLSSVEPLSADEMKKLAGTQSAFLEYFVSEDAITIFLVQNDKIRAHTVPARKNDLVEKARKWRGKLTERQNSEELARYFYEKLIAPVAESITRNQVIIIPHDVLHYLPFQAIQDGNTYLIEKYALSYAPSATALKIAERKKSTGNKKILIMGNPTQDLKFAEEEAKKIAAIWPDATLLTGKQASIDFLRQQGGRFEYLHFATHGIYDDEHPLNSGIIFGELAKRQNILTAAELFSTQWQASLVTLSACETGLSRQKRGDELIGLQRALMFAGARTILSSLWSIDDMATGFLMTSFYRHLSKMPKNKALKQAQLETMKQFPDPYYWASFNLAGARD